jgi:hypothetical protein
MADENHPMNDQSNDPSIGRALREALDVSPSPDFVARVRTRIANEPAPRGVWSRWTLWMPVTVGAVAAAIALAVLVARPDRTGTAARVQPSTASAAASDVRLPAPSVREGKPGAAAATAAANVASAPATNVVSGFGRTDRAHVVSASRRTVEEPEVLISQSESAALRRLLARASEGQIVVDVSSASIPDSSEELQPAPEIVIPPLKIDPLVPVNGEEGVRQ